MLKKNIDLRRRRVALGFSQEEIAKVIGISSRTIQRIESGANPSMVFRRRIELEVGRMEKGRGMIR